MGRYTGPVCRLCRRAGVKLYLKGNKCYTNCVLEKRPYPPGQHGPERRQFRLSDRGIQLREKQKARYIYGMMERQFRRFFEEARRQKGVTGENLVKLLERRLDNVVYRLGFAESRNQARQLVRHGHITVNGRKADIPSMLLRPGDTVGWTPQGQRTALFEMAKAQVGSRQVPSWLSLDTEAMTGRVLSEPNLEEVPVFFNTASIVEYYSR
ncbi:MAG: 30S ribosomal protein S4 [Dehalococcoidia bacterium]|jgi:small subunit ribosomal protein S4|nr:30S ribosomal protein S4 [Dehalococcoidia bacterium]MDW8008257.1 30S ribosomal protein S4 [Chloroflexota bacterium]